MAEKALYHHVHLTATNSEEAAQWYADIFDGSRVIAGKVAAMEEAAWAEIEAILAAGGAVAAVTDGSTKQKLVRAGADLLISYWANQYNELFRDGSRSFATPNW